MDFSALTIAAEGDSLCSMVTSDLALSAIAPFITDTFTEALATALVVGDLSCEACDPTCPCGVACLEP